jgi:propanol-preferring alcohol dehydrogenase
MAFTVPLTAKGAVLTELLQDYLVKLNYSGVCHSDISIQRENWGVKPEFPLIRGHEGVGHIVAIGEHSDMSKIGDRVGVKWIATRV